MICHHYFFFDQTQYSNLTPEEAKKLSPFDFIDLYLDSNSNKTFGFFKLKAIKLIKLI